MSGLPLSALVFGDVPWSRMGERETRFRCSCSREKYRSSIKSIGIRELRDIAEAGEGAEVVCRFCGEKYWFPPEETAAMLAERTAELKSASAKRKSSPPEETT